MDGLQKSNRENVQLMQPPSLTYPRKRKPHLIYFDLVNQGKAHAVRQNYEGCNDVHDGFLRQGAVERTDQIRKDT